MRSLDAEIMQIEKEKFKDDRYMTGYMDAMIDAMYAVQSKRKRRSDGAEIIDLIKKAMRQREGE